VEEMYLFKTWVPLGVDESKVVASTGRLRATGTSENLPNHSHFTALRLLLTHASDKHLFVADRHYIREASHWNTLPMDMSFLSWTHVCRVQCFTSRLRPCGQEQFRWESKSTGQT